MKSYAKSNVIIQDISTDISGLDVLITDDISDTGRSTMLAYEHALAGNPNSMRFATMCVRKGSLFIPDYSCIEVDDEWVVHPGEEKETIRSYLRNEREDILSTIFSQDEIDRVKYQESHNSNQNRR